MLKCEFLKLQINKIFHYSFSKIKNRIFPVVYTGAYPHICKAN